MGSRTSPLRHETGNDLPDTSDPVETARYIARLAGELRAMALKVDRPFLAYLLAMAEEDALSGRRER